MKKNTILMLVISLIALTLIAAGNPHVRVGDRLVFPPGEGEFDYSANMPFYIAHGWSSTVGEDVKVTTRGGLRLVIDGEDVEEDFIEIVRTNDGVTNILSKWFVFNFPDGMTGTHTFEFYYSNTCSYFRDIGLVDECDHANQIIELLTKSWVVNFL